MVDELVFNVRAILNTQEITKRIDDASKNISNKLRGTGKPLEEIKKGMNDSFKSDGIEKATKKTEMFSSALKKSKVIVASLGAAIIGLGAFGIKAAADMEVMANNMETAFKGNKEKAQDYFKWANKFSNVTPFENAEVIQASVMLSMRGLDPKKVLGKIGDMAASMGKPLGDAVQGMLQASVGEMEIMKGFGISKEDIRKHGVTMGFNDLVNTKGSITDAKKFTTVLLDLMDSKFKGSMERQSKTFKGVVSTLKGVSTFAMSKFAGVQEDGTTRVGSAFDLVKNRLADYADALNEAVDNGTIDRWASKIDGIVASFTDLTKKVGENAREMAKTPEFKKIFEGAKGIFNEISSGFSEQFKNLSENSEGFKAFGMLMLDVFGSVLPFIKEAIGLIFELASGIWKITNMVLTEMQPAFVYIGQVIEDFFNKASSGVAFLREKFINNFNLIKESVSFVMETIKTNVKNAIDYIKEKIAFFSKIYNTLARKDLTTGEFKALFSNQETTKNINENQVKLGEDFSSRVNNNNIENTVNMTVSGGNVTLVKKIEESTAKTLEEHQREQEAVLGLV